MPRIARFGILVVILALVGAGTAAAQNTSGAIAGTITDTQGGVLPGGVNHRHQLRDRRCAYLCD